MADDDDEDDEDLGDECVLLTSITLGSELLN